MTDQMDVSQIKKKKNNIHSLFICKIQWKRGGMVLLFQTEGCIIMLFCYYCLIKFGIEIAVGIFYIIFVFWVCSSLATGFLCQIFKKQISSAHVFDKILLNCIISFVTQG